jgi:phospholipid/cholesterol/gamma-HCH transport system ATP-binding protein
MSLRRRKSSGEQAQDLSDGAVTPPVTVDSNHVNGSNGNQLNGAGRAAKAEPTEVAERPDATEQVPPVIAEQHSQLGAKKTEPEAIISLRGVTKSFGSHTVLDDISFDVPRGKITMILGPSGTGKSVLLKNIIGLLRPDAGQIWVDGEPLVGMRSGELYQVRKKFGVLFQDGALFGSMNLYDNIAFPLREHTHKSEREIRQLVLMNAELVGLLDHLKKLPGEVSGGMKKRAGLARAMVTEPEIVLFDEPDSGLDPVRVAYLDELVLTAQKETGATFFIITHNITSMNRVADYLGVLFRSKLVAFGSKEQMSSSSNPVIRQFLAGRPEGPIGMDELADSDDDSVLAGYGATAPAAVVGGAETEPVAEGGQPAR